MWSCNDFMGPLLYVQTPAKYPLSLFVKLSMDGDTGFAWNKILALSLISILQMCIRDRFKSYDMGMASALAWIMFIIVCILTIIAFTSQKKCCLLYTSRCV